MHLKKTTPLTKKYMPKIIKQDINFLDKPLWFQNLRNDGSGFVWKDVDDYEYRTGYLLPDKVDMVILLYFLLKSQQVNYENSIKLSRYEVLKACDMSLSKAYYKRLEDSLKRWKNVSIEYRGNFYDGKKYKSMFFGILNDAVIADDGQIEIDFNEKWLLKIKESTFFKYLNFEYYKTLKRPLSRRLYEILCKTFKARDNWSITLLKLGKKLTLSNRTVTTKNGEKQVMYASDVIVALKPAIKEINRLALIPNIVEKTGIHPNDLFRIDFFITGTNQDRVIHFKKKTIITDKSDSPKIIELKILIPPEHREKKTINVMINRSFKKHGSEYVKRNIEYTNYNHKQNYRTFLNKALKEDWGRDHMALGNIDSRGLRKGALDCWKRCYGNCGATWVNYKNNKTNMCYYCQKFKNQR